MDLLLTTRVPGLSTTAAAGDGKSRCCKYGHSQDKADNNVLAKGERLADAAAACKETMVCHGDRHKCFATGTNSSTGFKYVHAGCWYQNDDSHENFQGGCPDTSCHLGAPTRDISFCCCRGNMCNSVLYPPNPANYTTGPEVITTVQDKTGQELKNILVFAVVPILLLAIVVVVAFYLWRRFKTARPSGGGPYDGMEVGDMGRDPLMSPYVQHDIKLDAIKLLQVKARGRFGAVWEATVQGRTVAVKVFPLQDRQSWIVEQEMYGLPHMQQGNILRFLGAGRSGEGMEAELWLVSEFHPLGSLYDHLKANVLDWPHTLKVAESMMCGLAHVHEYIAQGHGLPCKPPIAHRDFKSRNVLLKADLTACIADLGLAIKFEPGKPVGETHGQVGTRRYMAPEVLEGAINFTQDAFLRIDMYAAALVLWELAARCTAADGPLGQYMLPLEAEVGAHPTLEDMQDMVVSQKKRPLIREDWHRHRGLNVLSGAMDECWDNDAEARLSASCVLERLRALIKDRPNQQGDGLVSLDAPGDDGDGPGVPLLPPYSALPHPVPAPGDPRYRSPFSGDISLEAPSVDSAVDVSPVADSDSFAEDVHLAVGAH